MNEQQRLYLAQARSDWEIFQLLDGRHPCHRLHYLQMLTEKLAKAYFWQHPGAEALGHAAFVRFILRISNDRAVAAGNGFPDRVAFRRWVLEIASLAHQLERLAPALTDGPNPEYPWPRSLPTHAPSEHRFEVWEAFRTRDGMGLLRPPVSRSQSW